MAVIAGVVLAVLPAVEHQFGWLAVDVVGLALLVAATVIGVRRGRFERQS